jgi:hypothetical protein
VRVRGEGEGEGVRGEGGVRVWAGETPGVRFLPPQQTTFLVVVLVVL